MSTELTHTDTDPRLVVWNGAPSGQGAFWLPESGRLLRPLTDGDNVRGTYERRAELAIAGVGLGAFKAHFGLGAGSYIMKPVTAIDRGSYRPVDVFAWHTGPNALRELAEQHDDELSKQDIKLMQTALDILGIRRP